MSEETAVDEQQASLELEPINNTDKAAVALAYAQDLVIVGPDRFLEANTVRLGVDALMDEIAKVFDPIIEKNKAALAEAQEQKEASIEPLDKAYGIIKRKMIRWANEMKELRLEEQKKLDYQARKKAEAERAELIETMKAAELDTSELEKAKLDYEVESVPDIVPKVEEFRYRTNWTFSLFCNSCDAWILSREVKKHQKLAHKLETAEIPQRFYSLDLSAIGAEVKEHRNLTKIPGIKVEEEKI